MTGTVATPWLAELREMASERFAKLGFPTTHEEDWRFTNVAPIARTRWGKPAEKWGVDVRPRKDFGRWVTFVNGRFAPQLSSDLPAGVELLDVAHPKVQQHLGRYAPYQTHPFVALNTANLDEGIFLEIAKGAVVEEPIELVYLSNDMDGAATHPRNLILIGAQAQVSLVESFAGTSGRYFTNAVTEIVAGEGAVVDHYKLQMESPDAFHIASMQVELARDVNFTSQSIALGAALARNDITAVLSEGTECTLNGFYLVNGTQHVDTHTAIDHAKPHGTSHELYKGILGGRANAVFNGKILVRKDAQKTDAKQTNKNLVLSEDATINTKPELQIFADDVRCTHGATIGQIDPESLFYLQARGIGRDEARSMLIVAFARDVLDRIKIEPLREMVEQMVGERLSEGFMSTVALTAFDVARIRQDFPILKLKIHDKPLVYLDNAATSQKPRQVIDAITNYYLSENSNIHRGVHELSQRATEDYEKARAKMQRFLNAAHAHEIIFVRGTTEGINLVAQTYGRANVGEGDEVVISAFEHHSNIVPWQILCDEKGAKLRVAPINDAGELMMDEFERLLNQRTRLVAISHVSNALGSVNPARRIVEMAHRHGIPVLLDGAQAVPHMHVDVQSLDCDFYALSGHKMYGPTGIGVLYGKTSFLEKMPPYQAGGDMISSVTFEKTTYNTLPYKFEAGTPDIAGVIGFGAAVDYLNEIGMENIAAHEHDLVTYGTALLERIPGLRLIGTAREKAGVLSFVIEGVHPHDVGTVLDQQGIAVRTGHHCAQPVMDRFGVPATSRASFGLYNTRTEIDRLVEGIGKVKEIFEC